MFCTWQTIFQPIIRFYLHLFLENRNIQLINIISRCNGFTSCLGSVQPILHITSLVLQWFTDKEEKTMLRIDTESVYQAAGWQNTFRLHIAALHNSWEYSDESWWCQTQTNYFSKHLPLFSIASSIFWPLLFYMCHILYHI